MTQRSGIRPALGGGQMGGGKAGCRSDRDEGGRVGGEGIPPSEYVRFRNAR